jgi:hypothetical protein
LGLEAPTSSISRNERLWNGRFWRTKRTLTPLKGGSVEGAVAKCHA